MNKIEEFYDNQYEEWDRFYKHPVEFEMTKRYIDSYIPNNSLDIIDIGGGPGRYSFYLASKGHRVTLLDLSKHNIDTAKEKSKELGINLVEYIKGNALELENIKKKYDVVLLMGPLYHLVKEEDRRKALKGALDLLKDDGVIVASFISNYAPLQDSFRYFDLTGNEPYDALKYIASPSPIVERIAIKNNEAAIHFVKELDQNKILEFLKVNILVIKHVGSKLTQDELEDVLKQVLADENVEEKYVRDFLNCNVIDRNSQTMPIDKILFIYRYGSQKAKKIAVDERLKML